MKKKKFVCFPSTYLFIADVMTEVVAFFYPTFIIITMLYPAVMNYEELAKDPVEHICFYLMCCTCVAGYIMGIAMPFTAMGQWFEKLTITENGIEIHPPFKKVKRFNYDSYRYMEYGYYDTYSREWFFVISNRRMSRYELSNLNKIKKSDDYIKIKYSKRRFYKLRKILPDRMMAGMKDTPR